MIISIDAKKALDKIQHAFTIKTLAKMGIYLSIIKAIYDKPTINTIINAEKLPTKIWKKTRMPTLPIFFQHSIWSPSHSNQTRKRNRSIQIGREEVKLSLYADDDTVCVCSVMSKSLQAMDFSLPGSSVHGIFQARILERVAISYSRGSSWPRDWICVSCFSCLDRHDTS